MAHVLHQLDQEFMQVLLHIDVERRHADNLQQADDSGFRTLCRHASLGQRTQSRERWRVLTLL